MMHEKRCAQQPEALQTHEGEDGKAKEKEFHAKINVKK